MTFEKLNDMFDMFKSNNKNNKSMGVSGLGGKESIYILSKNANKTPSTVIIFTHSQNGEYWKATVPWDEIISSKKYTDAITFCKMSEEEIIDFNNDREGEENPHGTTIRWQYSDILRESITIQFDKKNRENIDIVESEDRWDLIFGCSNIDIILDKSDGTPLCQLPKFYNYFEGDETEFYAGKNIEIIDHYIDTLKNDRYIWTDENNNTFEIGTTGKNTKTKPQPVIIHTTWTLFGCYEIYNGMRKDDNIFNEQRPKDKKSATFSLNSYDQQFFKTDKQTDKIKEFLSRVRLNRNVQNITQIKLEGYNVASARADSSQLLKLVYHRTEIRYETLSTQNNRMDIAMGIQENKHQNQNKIPKTIERLICFLKNRNLEKIKAHFREVTDTYDNLQRQRQKEINDQKIAALLQQQLALQQQRLLHPESESEEEDYESESETESEEEDYESESVEDDVESVSTVNTNNTNNTNDTNDAEIPQIVTIINREMCLKLMNETADADLITLFEFLTKLNNK